jgi:hypothetical protein
LVLGTVFTVATVPARPASAAANASSNRMTGVSFLTENQPISGSSGEFQRIKSDGANTVSFDVWWVVPSQSSSSIAPAPSITDSDADLIAAAQQAHQVGLRVTLTPKFVVGSNTWRGYYNPPDPATFFSNYRTMINHYADLAQQTGMSLFYVGSEMIDSDGYLDNWHQVIASARQHFGGPLSYEEDWREVGRFNFGDAVDLVSISAYFPISREASPTLGQLEAGWHQGADAFAAVAGEAQRWGKPILFGEVGYEASSHAGANPCCNSTNAANDAALQSRAYQALLDTFVGQPWWGGVTWWAWNNGDPRSPEGKPAEGLIGERAVAFPSPITMPGRGGPPSTTTSPVASRTDGPHQPTYGGAPPAPATATPPLPAAGDGPPDGSGGRPHGHGLPDPYGLRAPSAASTGLVGLRISHEGSVSADHVGETIVAALVLITGLAASVRFMARTAQSRRRA